MTTDIFAVEDNLVIEGNPSPGLYANELYKIIATPSEEYREIELSVYNSNGKIASQKAGIEAESDFAQFYVKFTPPLYEAGQQYTLEVLGDGLIGRMVFNLQDEAGSITSWSASEDKPSIIFITSNQNYFQSWESNIENFNSNEKLNIFGKIYNFDSNFRFISVSVVDPENKTTGLGNVIVDDLGFFHVEYGFPVEEWRITGQYKIVLYHPIKVFDKNMVITSSKYIQVNQLVDPSVFVNDPVVPPVAR